jgi:hypothetical protein
VYWGLRNERRYQSAGTAHLVCRTIPLVQSVEGEIMQPHKSESPVAAGQYAKKTTNDLDFPTGQRRSKTESTLCALLALTGHAVHSLKGGSYLVCKYGYTYLANDIDDLKGFALRLGVCHE